VLGRAVMPARGIIAAEHARTLLLVQSHIYLMGVLASARAVDAPCAGFCTLTIVAAVIRRGGGLSIGVVRYLDRILDHSVDGGVVGDPPGGVSRWSA